MKTEIHLKSYTQILNRERVREVEDREREEGG